MSTGLKHEACVCVCVCVCVCLRLPGNNQQRLHYLGYQDLNSTMG